jgi:putative holliday junction resolvase
MGRLLALDVGSKRIGVAVSDELGILASPHGVITRRSYNRDATAIATLIEELAVDRVIVGHPIGLAGQTTQQTRATEEFVRILADRIAVPITLWDERHTSTAAREIVGTSVEARRSGRVDAVAAAIILQSFLDTNAEAKSSVSTYIGDRPQW